LYLSFLIDISSFHMYMFQGGKGWGPGILIPELA
jgi:hypothetical protein